MIIKNQRAKETFEHKYWVLSNMQKALTKYVKTHDSEMFIESGVAPMCLFIYCDDISPKKMLEIYNSWPDLNPREKIPTIDQKLFDEGDLFFDKKTEFSEMFGKLGLPNLVMVENWK